MVGEIVAAIIGVAGTVVVTLLTYTMAKRAGIGPFQDTLVAKLKDLVDVQQQEIDRLKQEDLENKKRIAFLEKEVEDLKELTINQAKLINTLQKPTTRRRAAAVLEP